jgi:hypothetical protein
VLDPHAKLKTGQFAQAAIAGQRRQGVLVVPREAIVPGQDSSVLQVVDGRARRVTVQTGVGDGRQVEILQGIAEGSEVVAPAAGLADGDLIDDR